MASKMNLPGMDLMKGVGLGPINIGNVMDTMGFVKKAWGAMNAPSAFMPTVDVEELKKRIVDLQAVEQWLVMNLGMIQSSIQALEVQTATIETLKGVTKGWPGMEAASAQTVLNRSDVAGSNFWITPAEHSSPTRPTPDAPQAKPKKPSSRKSGAKAPASTAANVLHGSTTWLEFLQKQFNQVTQAAMSGERTSAASKSKPVNSPKRSSKSSPRSAPSGAPSGAPTTAPKTKKPVVKLGATR
jgi:hypothetical protein